MRSALASLALIVSKTYANQRAVIERIQEDGWLVTLLHDESSNTTLGGNVKLDKH
jgi:hypothetical protein